MSRSKELLKLLKRALKMEHLYTPEKLRELKQQLREVEKELQEIDKKNSKGFSKYETNKSK